VSDGPQKLICCIVPRGRGLALLETLRRERGVVAGHVHLARGLGRATPLGRRAFGEAAERDVVSVVVPAEQADAVFELLYFEGGIDQPHGGFVYQRSLDRATELSVPEPTQPASS
jgi:hypothetical protein